MKRKLKRRAVFDGKMLDFEFNFWPPYPATRNQPEETAEIEILSITDLNGNAVSIPSHENSEQEAEVGRMWELLLDIISNENDLAEQTIAIEPWD
jgi:hypothetical protein